MYHHKPQTNTVTTTPVKFYNENGQPLAVFPTIKERPGMVLCYSPTEQHSTASKEYIKKLEPATWDQYHELRNELINLGYNLEVLNIKNKRGIKQVTI